MKAFIITLILTIILLFAGCTSGTPAKSDDTTDNIGTETEVRTESEEIPEDDGIYVISITDRTVTESISTDDALEGFHADDVYVYIFPSIKSRYVTVKYSDQSEKPLKEAFYLGDITISDLDEYGIDYYKRSHSEEGDGSVRKIVYDIICDYDGAESDTEEIFYENSDYVYCFPNPLSDNITVLFTDGSEYKLTEAFEHSHISPHDLISKGIPVWERSKIDGSATFYSQGEAYYHEQ